MGSSNSKEVESNGEVVNNVIVQEPVSMTSDIKLALYCICLIKVIELIIYGYNFHRKNLKKKYKMQMLETHRCFKCF